MCSTEDIVRFTREIETDFRQSPGLILSEDDAKCLLFGKVHAHLTNLGRHRAETADNGVFASTIHSEIKFLDENGHLSIRPDISILDTKNLSILNSRHDLNIERKGFVFWGAATLIEIKFCKARRGIDSRFVNSIRRDCEKIEELRGRLYPQTEVPQLRGVVVVFNRSDRVCTQLNELVQDFANHEHVRVVYASANFRHAA